MTARSLTMVTLHDTGFVECRLWNDGWTVKTVVTSRSTASILPAPGVGGEYFKFQNPLLVMIEQKMAQIMV